MERYSRQIFFDSIGREGQRKLLQSHAVIIGCGALGTVIANNLARAGVGKLTVVDRDYVELSNLQRQTLFTESDASVRLPKAAAAEIHLKRINSGIEIKGVVGDVSSINIENLISGAHIVLDGTDNFSTRFLINDACVKHDIPWVYGGAVSSYGMVMPVYPGRGPCFRCFINSATVGSSMTCDTVGVLNSVTGIVGNLEANEAIKVLVGASTNPGGIISIDVWSNRFENIQVAMNPECPACAQGKYEFLSNRHPQTAVMCGRNAVQVTPGQCCEINFDEFSKRVKGVKTSYNKFLLRLNTDRFEITLFKDGRAIIQGTDNPDQAMSVYAQYIGM